MISQLPRVHAKLLLSRPTLWDPMDCSLPGSSVHGILQARILEWFAISFSRGSSQPRDWTYISCIGRKILYCWATGEAPRRGRYRVRGEGTTFLDGKPFQTLFVLNISVSWRNRQRLCAIFKKIKQQTSKKFKANDRPLRIRLLLVLARLTLGDKWWLIVRVTASLWPAWREQGKP